VLFQSKVSSVVGEFLNLPIDSQSKKCLSPLFYMRYSIGFFSVHSFRNVNSHIYLYFCKTESSADECNLGKVPKFGEAQ
jgi:hypothetical protein